MTEINANPSPAEGSLEETNVESGDLFVPAVDVTNHLVDTPIVPEYGIEPDVDDIYEEVITSPDKKLDTNIESIKHEDRINTQPMEENLEGNMQHFNSQAVGLAQVSSTDLDTDQDYENVSDCDSDYEEIQHDLVESDSEKHATHNNVKLRHPTQEQGAEDPYNDPRSEEKDPNNDLRSKEDPYNDPRLGEDVHYDDPTYDELLSPTSIAVNTNEDKPQRTSPPSIPPPQSNEPPVSYNPFEVIPAVVTIPNGNSTTTTNNNITSTTTNINTTTTNINNVSKNKTKLNKSHNVANGDARASPLTIITPQPTPDDLWFAGDMSVKDVNKAVLTSPSGSFLVRKSSGGDRYVICVNDNGREAKLQLLKTPTGAFLWKGIAYKTVASIIQNARNELFVSPTKAMLTLAHPARGGVLFPENGHAFVRVSPQTVRKSSVASRNSPQLSKTNKHMQTRLLAKQQQQQPQPQRQQQQGSASVVPPQFHNRPPLHLQQRPQPHQRQQQQQRSLKNTVAQRPLSIQQQQQQQPQQQRQQQQSQKRSSTMSSQSSGGNTNLHNNARPNNKVGNQNSKRISPNTIHNTTNNNNNNTTTSSSSSTTTTNNNNGSTQPPPVPTSSRPPPIPTSDRPPPVPKSPRPSRRLQPNVASTTTNNNNVKNNATNNPRKSSPVVQRRAQSDIHSFSNVEPALCTALCFPGKSFYLKTPASCRFAVGGYSVYQEDGKCALMIEKGKNSDYKDLLFHTSMRGLYYYPSDKPSKEDGLVASIKFSKKPWRASIYGKEPRLPSQPLKDGSKYLYAWGDVVIADVDATTSNPKKLLVKLVTKTSAKGNLSNCAFEAKYFVQETLNATGWVVVPVTKGPPIAMLAITKMPFWTGNNLESIEVRLRGFQDNALAIVLAYIVTEVLMK